ncbi:MAG: hypothetical protein RBT68_03315 [Spirochaetia bacterium]|nr:hypothetical protein [Spirochaetia bacterium]
MKNYGHVPTRLRATSSFIYCVLGLASLSQAACTIPWPELSVSVVMPELPPAWSGADGWELDWRSLSTVGEACMACPGDTLVLPLPRTGFAAVRCRPVFGSFRGQPYGAIWPLDSSGLDSGTLGSGTLVSEPESTLVLDAGSGLAAELAFRLYQGGWDAAGFNFRRFAEEAELRMADPWDSDLAAVAQAVAEGRFRADYLKTPARIPVWISGLPGDMASDSPWGKSIQPDAQGLASIEASPGIHRWFGYAQELIVSVSSDGSAEWILRGADGRVIQKVLP